MATIEEEVRLLEKELRQTSMMTSAVRSAQSRLISTMTRHSDAVSKSIINTLQEITTSRDTIRLAKKRLDLLQKQLAQSQKQQDTDQKNLNDRSKTLNDWNTKNKANIEALKQNTAKTKEQEVELKKLITEENKLENELKRAVDAEKRSREKTEDLTGQIESKTKELEYVKFQTLATTVTALAGGMMSLAASVRETQQKFGIAANQATGLQFSNLKKSISSYVDALTGAGPAATMEQIAATQEAFQQQFGGVLDPEAAKRLTQEAIKMGVTAEQMADARRVFMTQTGGNLSKATAQTDKFIGEFKKKGLTAKDAMLAIQQNSELLARNGTRFATSFARAAADAKKIGVDLSKISQVGDNIISDFEGFLEKQAELGAMGFGFDTSKLAEIAETGSDADLFNELRSQLAATGKDITKLRRSERLALEGAYGINISDMLKMAGPTEGSGEKTMEQYQENANSLLTKAIGVLEGLGTAIAALGTLISTTIAASSALTAINTARIAARMGPGGSSPGSAPPGPSGGGGPTGGTTLTRGAKALSGAKVGAGVGALTGLVSGVAEYQESGNIKKAFGRGLANLAGSIIGGALGSFIPIPYVGTMLGATAGSWAANWLVDKVFADDVVSKPGYGKRTLLTPNGPIALNDKDNIIAYADDMVGTKRLPFGSITQKLANYGPAALSFFERGRNLSGGKGTNAVSHLLGMVTGKGGLSKYDFIPRTVSTLFGNVGKFAPGLTKFTAQNVKALPVVGSLLGGGLAGYDEYKKSGSILRGVGKGLFSAAGGTLGSIGGGVATLGNPIVASAGGIAGSFGGEMTFDAVMKSVVTDSTDDYISYADDLMGGKKLPLGAISKLFSSYKQGGFGGVKSSMMNTGLGMLGKKFPSLSGSIDAFKEGGFGGLKSNLMTKGTELLSKKIPGFSGAMSAFSAYKKGGVKGAIGSLAQGGIGKGIGAAIGTAIPIPFVGTAVGSLIGSKIGKLAGGLFGKKKQQSATISPEMMQAETMPDLSTFLGSQARREETKQAPQQPITVDTTGIEQKLNNFINALQNIQINMDGNKVGKVLVNAGDAAISTGVFRAQSR